MAGVPGRGSTPKPSTRKVNALTIELHRGLYILDDIEIKAYQKIFQLEGRQRIRMVDLPWLSHRCTWSSLVFQLLNDLTGTRLFSVHGRNKVWRHSGNRQKGVPFVALSFYLGYRVMHGADRQGLQACDQMAENSLTFLFAFRSLFFSFVSFFCSFFRAGCVRLRKEANRTAFPKRTFHSLFF